jgi:phospholipase/lecithinase/hemolysin
LGLPVTPSFAGGNDYAVGGAITGDTYFTVPGGTVTPFLTAGPGDLPSQVDAFLSSHPSAPSSALYTLSIGANDLFAALTAVGDQQINASQAGQIAYSAAQNVAAEVGDLKAAGAKTLILFDVPDLGLTPAFLGQTGATELAALFNSDVMTALRPLENGLVVHDLNTFGLLEAAVADPSQYGFSNVTTPCWTGEATGGPPTDLCSTSPAVQNSYFFWDAVHPTEAAQQLVAHAALAAIPEPSTWAMMLLGLVGVGFVGARRVRRTSQAASGFASPAPPVRSKGHRRVGLRESIL